MNKRSKVDQEKEKEKERERGARRQERNVFVCRIRSSSLCVVVLIVCWCEVEAAICHAVVFLLLGLPRWPLNQRILVCLRVAGFLGGFPAGKGGALSPGESRPITLTTNGPSLILNKADSSTPPRGQSQPTPARDETRRPPRRAAAAPPI